MLWCDPNWWAPGARVEIRYRGLAGHHARSLDGALMELALRRWCGRWTATLH